MYNIRFRGFKTNIIRSRKTCVVKWTLDVSAKKLQMFIESEAILTLWINSDKFLLYKKGWGRSVTLPAKGWCIHTCMQNIWDGVHVYCNSDILFRWDLQTDNPQYKERLKIDEYSIAYVEGQSVLVLQL